MKTLAFALCASMLLAAPAYAQSPDGGPPPGAGPGGPGDVGAPADMGGPGGGGGPGNGGGPGGGGAGGGGKMKEIMQTCRAQAKDQGLKGKELRQAAMDCAIKQKPAMADRLKCRMAGKDKGLKPGDEMKAFIKDCMHKNG